MTEKSLQVSEHTHVLMPGDVHRLQKPTPDHASWERRDSTVRNYWGFCVYPGRLGNLGYSVLKIQGLKIKFCRDPGTQFRKWLWSDVGARE